MRKTILAAVLVLSPGCPGPDFAAPPDAVCSEDELGELLSNFSLAFSAGFGPSHARLAADAFKDVKSGHPKAFTYENVTFGKRQLRAFELHAARRRSSGEIILWIRCPEDAAAKRDLEADLSRVSAELQTGGVSKTER